MRGPALVQVQCDTDRAQCNTQLTEQSAIGSEQMHPVPSQCRSQCNPIQSRGESDTNPYCTLHQGIRTLTNKTRGFDSQALKVIQPTGILQSGTCNLRSYNLGSYNLGSYKVSTEPMLELEQLSSGILPSEILQSGSLQPGILQSRAITAGEGHPPSPEPTAAERVYPLHTSAAAAGGVYPSDGGVYPPQLKVASLCSQMHFYQKGTPAYPTTSFQHARGLSISRQVTFSD